MDLLVVPFWTAQDVLRTEVSIDQGNALLRHPQKEPEEFRG